MFSKLFLKDTAERVLSTVAQVLLPVILADSFDVFSVDWKAMASLALAAAVGAFIKAVIASKTVDDSMSPASLVTADPNDLP